VGLVYPPKVVHPIQAVPVSFEQALSNKLHSTLVIRAIASKKVSTALLSSKLAKPTKQLHQPSLSDASDVKSKKNALLHTSNSVTASHTMSSNNSIIVQGTHKNKRILTAYKDKFGSEYPESIVTRKKGKISDDTFLHHSRMRPRLNKWYQVGDLQSYTLITTIIKECRVGFSSENLSKLCLVKKDFAKHCPKGTPLVTS
jgi:hypothetical protein